MRALVGHLIDDLGVHELAYVAGSIGSPDDDERWQGFREALTERGLPAPDAPDHRGEFTREGGRRAGRELVLRDRLPRAVVCANDQMALGATTHRTAVDAGSRSTWASTGSTRPALDPAPDHGRAADGGGRPCRRADARAPPH